MDKKRLPQPMTRIMLSPTDVTPPYHNIQRGPWVLFAIFTLHTSDRPKEQDWTSDGR